MDHDEIMGKIHKGIENIEGCHVWQNHMGNKQYPSPLCKHNKKYINIRRFIWNINFGNLKQGENIETSCGNSRCVNIEHLKLKGDIKWENEWKKLMGRAQVDGECIKMIRVDERTGYGRATLKSKAISAHRLSYMIKTRSHNIPETINGETAHIRHLCNVRACINPDHLSIGTASENMADKGTNPARKEFNAKKRKQYKQRQTQSFTLEQFKEAGEELFKKIRKAKIVTDIEEECWEYTGFVHPECGYGIFRYNGKIGKAHVWSREIHEKRLKDKGEVTRHLCGNKICVNPSHLRFGNQRENARDFIVKGSKVSRLTIENVKEIRNSNCSNEELALKFSVHRRAIYNVRSGKTWGYIE